MQRWPRHQALEKLGSWASAQHKLEEARNVRAALDLVGRGAASLGIVYETDALIDKRVRVVDVFPADSHLPIVYPVALTAAAKPEAAGFVEYIRGPAGAMAFKAAGFTPLH